MSCILSVTFSVIASAEEVDVSNIKLTQQQSFNGGTLSGATINFYPNNNEVEKLEKTFEYQSIRDTNWSNLLTIQNKNEDILVNKGEKTHVKVNNLYYSMLVQVNSVDESYSYEEYITRPDGIRATVNYTDGSSESFNDDVSFVVRKDKTINIDLSFTPSKDVQRIYISLTKNCASEIPYYNSVSYEKTLTFYGGEYEGDDKYQVSVDIQSEEVGLLEGILDKITSVADSILELPQKLWNLISEGLKSLFVPSTDYIIDYKEDMNNLLERKLGFVYQAITLLDSSWERVVFSDVTDTIYLPETTINLPGDTFTFGGFNVKVIPDRFSFMADSASVIIGIAATFAFINGAKKRYIELMEGVSSQ